MQDRVSLYPGRVTLTPVAGQANTYDMVRADQPTQEGTPLSKANLLSDTVAASYGEGTEAVPNDIFNILSRFHAGLGSEYLWEKAIARTVYSYNYTGKTNYPVATMTPVSTILYADTQDDAAAGIGTILTSSNYNSGDAFAAALTAIGSGKWISFSYEANVVIQVDFSTSAAWYNSSGKIYVNGSRYTYLSGEEYTHVGYVNSSDPDAYPIDDGNEYIALGQLGNKTFIEAGTYLGTYAYGEDNPNTLTFNFVPKIVIISAAAMTDANNCTPLVGINGTVCTYRGGSMYSEVIKTTWTFSGKTVSWYSSNVDLQMNNKTTYQYIAIG